MQKTPIRLVRFSNNYKYRYTILQLQGRMKSAFMRPMLETWPRGFPIVAQSRAPCPQEQQGHKTLMAWFV